MEKIGLINCYKISQKCGGNGCKKAFKERRDGFEKYAGHPVKMVRFCHCHGCGANALSGVLREADKMAKKGVTTIYLSSCIESVCEYHALFIAELSKRFNVIDFTHNTNQ
jgi:predicted metal-binding protein